MNDEAPTLVPLGLAGGQGKTTVALMTGRILARLGIPVLFVDADPQSSLSSFLGIHPSDERPTLLELITKPAKRVPLYSAIHPVPGNEDKLFVIPANDGLEEANHALAASPMSITALRHRLYQVGEESTAEDQVCRNFGIIIVDPPPERSHLALTALGAGNFWVIPAEANVKGVQSLQRTKSLIESCQPHINYGQFLGVVPFRARWVGLNPTATTKQTMQVMNELVGEKQMLPHILESDVFKRAINEQVLPRDLGHPELEYPLLKLIELLRPALGKYSSLVPNTLRELSVV
jgi:chromosome partitioning protein